MASAPSQLRNPNNKFLQEGEGRRSWGLIVLGLLLLLAAGLLLWWGLRNLPQPDSLTEDKLLVRTPPPNEIVKTESPISAASPTPTPQPKRLSTMPKQGFGARPYPSPRKESSAENSIEKFEALLRDVNRALRKAKEWDAEATKSAPAPVVKTTPTPDSQSKVVSPVVSPMPVSPEALASPALPKQVDITSPALPAPPLFPSPAAILSPTAAVSPTPQLSPKPAATPTDKCGAEAKHRNVFRKVVDWFVRLIKGKPAPCPANAPPIVQISATTNSLTLPCPPLTHPTSCPNSGRRVVLNVIATDPENDTLAYTWSVTGGSRLGEGKEVTWDFSGTQPGTYTAIVQVNDGNAHPVTGATTITLTQCANCEAPVACPTVSVKGPREVKRNAPITFVASLSSDSLVTYKWSVSPGEISDGQGTSSITVSTVGLSSQPVTAMLEVGGLAPSCNKTGSLTTEIQSPPARIGIIRGKVLRNNRPFAGAEVIAIDGAGTEYSGKTNENGDFQIAGLALGVYRLRVISPVVMPDQPVIVGADGTSTPVRPFILPADNASQTPTPTPVPDASPSPTASPVALSTPLKIVKESDQITAAFPDRFLQGKDSQVTVELERVLREVEQSQTVDVNTGIAKLIDRPQTPTGAKQDTVTPGDNSGLYDTYVELKLTGTGFTISPDAEPKPYSRAGQDPKDTPKQDWSWNVSPADGFTGEAELHFQMFVIWRSTNPAVKDREPIKVWDVKKSVGIGKPVVFVYGATGSSLLLFPGAAGLIVKGSRRKKTEDGEIAEEDLQAPPAPVAAAEESGDEVDSTVYAPVRARPGDSFLVQVFLHLPDQASVLDETATMSDRKAEKRDVAPLSKRIVAGTELTFHLTIPQLRIDTSEPGTWDGKTLRVRFPVTVPKRFIARDIGVNVRILEHSIPIGRLSFTMEIVRARTVASDPQRRAHKAKFYKQAFISYASVDRQEVNKRVQMLDLVKIGYFEDLLSLEPGDLFEKKIYQYIDESDVFFLFWSSAARKSRWVKKEVAYAIKRSGGRNQAPPEIVPVDIEGPPPAKPPRNLRHLHFNDKMSYFINPRETKAKN